MIEERLKPAVKKFIKDHENADPFKLAFQYKEVEGIPFQWIAQQIIGRQKVKSKIPDWYACDDVIYPAKLSLEQSSSQETAKYKASLVAGESFIDLTAGMGIDAWALSKMFADGVAIEQNAELSQITSHNLITLGAHNVSVKNLMAEEYLENTSEKFDLIYLDPARRVDSKKVFMLADCVPNIVELLPMLKCRSNEILVKTSPLMDIDLSIAQLPGVTDVHVVSVNNDCKEVLYHITSKEKPLQIHTVNFTTSGVHQFNFEYIHEKTCQIQYGDVEQFLYEPNASILKSGAFKTVASQFQLSKLHPNTHLYTGNNLIPEFPGRIFEVESVLAYSKKEFKGRFDQNKANITIRNFPDSVDKIRKKLDLRDGGDVYLFAFTNFQGRLQIAQCSKGNIF